VATGQEITLYQISELLLKYGSFLLNIVLGLIIYIYKRELKNHNTVYNNFQENIKKDLENFKNLYEKNCLDVHESFQNISNGIKEERSFWQGVFNKIKENTDELYNLANINGKNIISLQAQLTSEIKRLDEKNQSLKDLMMYKNGKKENADKNN
jgi:hypothetical protein